MPGRMNFKKSKSLRNRNKRKNKSKKKILSGGSESPQFVTNLLIRLRKIEEDIERLLEFSDRAAKNRTHDIRENYEMMSGNQSEIFTLKNKFNALEARVDEIEEQMFGPIEEVN